MRGARGRDGHRRGVVYVFERSPAGWSERAVLSSRPTRPMPEVHSEDVTRRENASATGAVFIAEFADRAGPPGDAHEMTSRGKVE